MTVEIVTQCPRCRRDSLIEVPKSGYEAWKSGMLIQRALPTLAADQREQLMTGICGECWDVMFKEDEDDGE